MNTTITPRSFGQVFGQSAPLLGGAFALGMYLLNPRLRYDDGGQLLFLGIFFGVCMGLVAAYQSQGKSLIRESDDPKKTLQETSARLAGVGYSLESQTEFMHTFKPPMQGWIGGRIYVQFDERAVQIVGPQSVLKKLESV